MISKDSNIPENKLTPFISVIIVNYNGRRFLEKCLASLLKQNYPTNGFEIIVVDNGSSDDSVEYMRLNWPFVRVIDAKKTWDLQQETILVSNMQRENFTPCLITTPKYHPIGFQPWCNKYWNLKVLAL